MKRFFAVLVCVSIASTLSLGVVGAAQNSSMDIDETDGCKSIDSMVYLCDSNYDSDTGQATLEFYSMHTESVELLDAGAALGGERTEQREFTLRGGVQTTITYDVTEYQELVAVMIGTERGVIKTEKLASPSQSSLPTLPGSPSSMDWGIATGAALLSSTVVIGVCGWWFKRDNRGGVRVF